MNKNGSFWKIVAVVAGFIITVSGWIWNAAILSAEVGHNSQNMKSHQKEIDMAGKERQMTNEAVIRLQSDVGHIKEMVDQNARIQQEILRELRAREPNP